MGARRRRSRRRAVRRRRARPVRGRRHRRALSQRPRRRVRGHDTFWYDEYVMNAQIGRFSKPYVALMDGIVMGGGVGVAPTAASASSPTPRKWRCPKWVSASFPTSAAPNPVARPGLLGLHAALTGAPFGGGRRDRAGLRRPFRAPRQARRVQGGDHRRRHRRRPGSAATEPPASELLAQREWIDECYAGETVADIVAALRGHDAGPAPTTRPT